MAWRFLAFVALAASAAAAFAARVDVPLRVPLEAISQALAAQVQGDAFREGTCRYLTLGKPRVESAEGRLKVTAPGNGALGLELLGKCQAMADWEGTVQLALVPRIDEDGKLRVRVADSKLVDARGKPGETAMLLWEVGKPQIHPRLEKFSYDLGASRQALSSVLRSVAPADQAAAIDEVLKGLEVQQPRVETDHVVVPVALDLPDAWLVPAASPSASAAPLTEAELEALEKSLEPWDAFLVYAIRQIAADSPALRKRLFTLLLDSRYQLVSLLAGDEPAGPDPLRTLFLDAWNELRSILSAGARDGLLGTSVLRYALFVEGGDALLALQGAAPGLRLTPDGLRQLARSIDPNATLSFGWEMDAELRQMFGVEEIKTSAIEYFIRAADTPALDKWIPKGDELPLYEKQVSTLLQRIASDERKALAEPYDRIYQSLVPTTALIESCWRQYVARSGKVTYLKSQAGSVGIMQINQHVWRGFYDVNKLRWDTAYNMRAGAQILLRYVKDYAIPYAEKAGNPDVVPRAAYAVYNAGPRAVGRFDKKKPHPREARVDKKLWTLYQGVASGGEPDLKSCSVKPKSL